MSAATAPDQQRALTEQVEHLWRHLLYLDSHDADEKDLQEAFAAYMDALEKLAGLQKTA